MTDLRSGALQSTLGFGKAVERLARRLVKNSHPALLLHELRWRLGSQLQLAELTRRRLQIDPHFWLFVLGLNNSGTTLLADLLGSHSLVRSLPNEGQYLTAALPLPRRFGVPRNFTRRLDVFHWTETADPDPALRIQYDWSHYCQRRPGILMEKSPPNTLRSRWLQEHFRPSRFVAIFRHPYAVCEGIRRRDGNTISEAARHWVCAHELLLEDIEHLRDCLCIKYEELCARPEEHLILLQRFLGLETPFEPGIVGAVRSIHNIDGAAGAIRNFNMQSVRQLTSGDIALIDAAAGPLMDRLGYRRLQLRDVYEKGAATDLVEPTSYGPIALPLVEEKQSFS